MTSPPPLPSLSPGPKPWGCWRIGGIFCGVLLVIALGGYLVFHTIIASGMTAGPDAMFGDQNLKTTVALVELYKVRYGKYPATLRDLKFTGQWDQIALSSVSYYPNADRTAYFVEVQRGWMGKPKLIMPDEFWRGTGYSPSLKPKGE